MIGAQSALTTEYHPQANGIIERFHCQTKASLKAKLNTSNWVNELPLVLLGIPTALRKTSVVQQQRWCTVKHSGFLENSLFLLQMHQIHMPFSHTVRVTRPDCVQLQPGITSRTDHFSFLAV